MNKKMKSIVAILFTTMALFTSGCGENSTTKSTPVVEVAQESSAEQLEAPPVAPALN